MNYGTIIKGAVSAAVAWISLRLGALGPIMALLAAAMALDFLSAWLRAYTTGEKLQSRKAAKGFVKKLGYIIAVIGAAVLDGVIKYMAAQLGTGFQWPPIFAILIAAYLTLIDIISIIENLHNSGISTPPFFGKIVKTLKDSVEKQGEQAAGQAALEQKYDTEGE